jgi:hypothetical protein
MKKGIHTIIYKGRYTQCLVGNADLDHCLTSYEKGLQRDNQRVLVSLCNIVIIQSPICVIIVEDDEGMEWSWSEKSRMPKYWSFTLFE